MTIYLRTREKRASMSDCVPVHDEEIIGTLGSTSLDDADVDIYMRKNGQESSIQIQDVDIQELLGRSCRKESLDDALKKLLPVKRKSCKRRRRSGRKQNTRRRASTVRRKRLANAGNPRSCRRRRKQSNPRVIVV